MEELKHCPACNCIPTICREDGGWIWIRCSNKNCPEQYETDAKNTLSAAILSWNAYVLKTKINARRLP